MRIKESDPVHNDYSQDQRVADSAKNGLASEIEANVPSPDKERWLRILTEYNNVNGDQEYHNAFTAGIKVRFALSRAIDRFSVPQSERGKIASFGEIQRKADATLAKYRVAAEKLKTEVDTIASQIDNRSSIAQIKRAIELVSDAFSKRDAISEAALSILNQFRAGGFVTKQTLSNRRTEKGRRNCC